MTQTLVYISGGDATRAAFDDLKRPLHNAVAPGETQ